MTPSNPRLELSVGAFLLLAFATLLVLAFATTNGKLGLGGDRLELTARFANVGELRVGAPVKIGGVAVGAVAAVDLDPVTYDAVATLAIDRRFEIPADTNAKVLTAGLLGERYIGLSPGGDPELLADGDEITFTQGAVVLEDLISRYLFNSDAPAAPGDAPSEADPLGPEYP